MFLGRFLACVVALSQYFPFCAVGELLTDDRTTGERQENDRMAERQPQPFLTLNLTMKITYKLRALVCLFVCL
jgi:hypothetical protein